MTCHFAVILTLMTFFYLIATLLVDGRFTIGNSFENRSSSDLTWITCAAIPIHILAVKRNDHGMSLTVQRHQIPSSSTVSALKPTVCGSAIVFLVNVGSARAIKTGLDQQRRKTQCSMSLHSVARIRSGVQCPSAILVPHCACFN